MALSEDGGDVMMESLRFFVFGGLVLQPSGQEVRSTAGMDLNTTMLKL